MFNGIIREVFSSHVVPQGVDRISYWTKVKTILHQSAPIESLYGPIPPRQKHHPKFYDHLFGDHVTTAINKDATDYVVQKIQRTLLNPSLLTDLPAMPESVSTVITMLQDQDFNIHELIGVIEREPGMAAELIKLANSARYFRGETPVADIRTAFNYMGTRGLMDGVLQSFLKHFSACPQTYYSQYGEKIWQHCFETAQTSQMLVELKLGSEHSGVGFFVGLMRNLGHMILFQLLTQSFRFVEPEYYPASQSFKALLDRYSLPLTVLIAKHWTLPEQVVQALEQQSEDHKAVSQLAKYVKEAELICQLKAVYEGELITEDEFKTSLLNMGMGQTATTLGMQYIQSQNH